MIIIDTSVWIGYFTGNENPKVNRLDQALAARAPIGVMPIILTEVLQGFRSDNDFTQAHDYLTRLPIITPPIGAHIRAAQLYRILRRKGVTVRGAVDCIIAQCCIDTDARLLTGDGDFDQIAHHTELKLV